MFRKASGKAVVCACLLTITTASLFSASPTPSPLPAAPPPAAARSASPLAATTASAASQILAGTTPPTGTTSPTSTPDPTASPEPVLAYEKVLADRADHFESFIQTLCTILVSALGGLVALFGVLIAIHHRRDVATVKNDLRTEYTKKIGEDLEKAKSELATEFRKKADDEITKIKSGLEPELQQIGRGMTAQIDAAVTKATEDLRTRLDDLDAEITQPLFYNVVEYASVISQATAILALKPAEDEKTRQDQFQERGELIDRFRRLQDRVVHHRTFNILLGRLLAAQGDHSEAAMVLTKAIDLRKISDLRTDNEKIDFGALHFNRACYRNLLAKEAGQDRPELAEDHASKAWEDLKVWARLAPNERGAEVKDDDLIGLVGRPPRTGWDLLWSDETPESKGA